MSTKIDKILKKDDFNREELKILLETSGEEQSKIYKKAAEIKSKYVGNRVYLRGLVEFSNVCSKNCYYCGIRRDNAGVERYNLTDDEILGAAMYAHEKNYGSIVLQSGEVENEQFSARVEKLLKEIKKTTADKLGITISLGEQNGDVYQRWLDAGAHRYLLRIETSNPELFEKIHPRDSKHNFTRRLSCLKALQKTGYQTGTGVMTGLPFQTTDDIARDILFMRDFDIDMVGLGPYIEHRDTPLFRYRHMLPLAEERLHLALKMTSLLRIIMKDINIAAATALQAIDPMGREKALMAGANVIMPNITPSKYRNSYLLYENKPCTDEAPDDCSACLRARVQMTGNEICYGEWGDSRHFFRRTNPDEKGK